MNKLQRIVASYHYNDLITILKHHFITRETIYYSSLSTDDALIYANFANTDNGDICVIRGMTFRKEKNHIIADTGSSRYYVNRKPIFNDVENNFVLIAVLTTHIKLADKIFELLDR